METKVVTRITIEAPAEKVFLYLTDLKYHHLWNPQVQRISNHGKLHLGDGYTSVSLLMGIEVESHNVVTKFIAPQEFEIENKVGMIQYVANFRLVSKDKKTVVICTTTVSSKSNAFAFAKPIMKVLARRELQTDMQALKIAVEHQLK